MENKYSDKCNSVKKMIDYLIKGKVFKTNIEKKLEIQEKKWEIINNEENLKIWRKNIKNNIYIYSTYTIFNCSQLNFFNFISDLENRKKWDTSVEEINILKKEENSLIYDWESKRPWPYGNIFHLCKQIYIKDENYKIVTKSVSPQSFDINKNVIRSDNYFSYTYIDKINENKCAVYCLFLDDQKINIPNIVYSNLSYIFIPTFVKDINNIINKNINNEITTN